MRRIATIVWRDERGSVLFVAVTAMMILGVFVLSFALLADIESAIGLNYKTQAQAEATAEAGLDWARDKVRSAGAPGLSPGFTPWFDGTSATHLLTPGGGQPLGAFTFKARVDNDCASANTVPSDIQESAACNNDVDHNQTAVLTSWATVGGGRARVRALITVDSPWKHVCANSKSDPAGSLCTGADAVKGNPAIVPADTQDPNGPRGFDALPLPIIGCSRIDAAVHGAAAYCSTAASSRLYAQPAASGYDPYPAVPSAGGPPLVIMGQDPVLATTARKCNIDPESAAVYYFGYFDCALSTPCDGPLGLGPCVTTRKGCLHPADSRVTAGSLHHDPTRYVAAPCGSNTGMVFTSLGSPLSIAGDLGGPETPYVVYVQHNPAVAGPSGAATVHVQAVRIYGTVVVEGSFEDKGKAEICAGAGQPTPPPSSPCPLGYSTASPPTKGYGYPLAILTYDPKLDYPRIHPPSPQPYPTVGTNLSLSSTVNGSVYSGGGAAFHPGSVNGSTVAFAIDVQANASTHTYVPQYGNDAPPQGFPPGSVGPIVMIPRTFVVCSTYSDDVSAATPCQ